MDVIMTVHCNDRTYRVNMSNMRCETFDLEGNPTSFCDDKYEYNTLVERIYRMFYERLKVNLPMEVLHDLDF